MIIKDFINKIITFHSIDDILNSYSTFSEKGLVFEKLFDIIIKFGFCHKFNNYNYFHLVGNVNNSKLKILTNFDKYLNQNIFNGNSSGCSDITLLHKITNKYIFITSKYSNNNNNVDYYDVQNILAMINDNKHLYKKYDIYLLVKNKKKVLDKVDNANISSKYITKYMSINNIFDKDDLNKYFLLFKQDIIKNINNDWNQLYLVSKTNLNLRFHQELITTKTLDLIHKGNKSFLWGCKCRSGKTYMVGGLIIKLLNIKSKLNVLIITPAPTETISQFTDDLFHKFKDFDICKIHYISNSKLIQSIQYNDNYNIFIMSKQLLQKYINDDIIIKDLKLDLIVFDENHFTGTTDLSKDILNSYSSKNTIKIFLTATYNKPLKEWKINKDCLIFWDIEDEQLCKNKLIDKLKEKHGDKYINDTLDLEIYNNMPELCLITSLFDNQRYENIKNIIQDSVYGFSFEALFDIQNNKFKYEYEIKTLLQYISGDFKEINYPKNDKSIYTRINSIKTRPIKTQIWFLPPKNINEISKNLKILMLEDNILNKYDIMIINSKVERLAKDIKDEITKNEIIAHDNNKKGLILLVGNMLSLGITLENCDMVILLNNTLSCDKIMQQMYRCMTEGENKKYGFVVDLNISRVLNTCISSNYKNNLTIEDKLKYIIDSHLINIDIDMFENKKLDSDKLIKKILEIWKNDPINNFKTLLRNLDNEFIVFDNDTQKLINKSFMNSIKDKTNLTIEINNELQELPNGIEINDQELLDSVDKNTNSDTPEKIINISFTKEVLPYIIPLTCILTIKNNNKDFVKMLNDIQETNELLDIFNDQTLIWWNQKDLIKIIIKIINRYFNKESNTFNICINFKLSVQSLIDKPKELLELINECLKPKTIEKKKFGEVFTPIKLVNEMLDKLPNEVWLNKNLKWLDPANGMGNFPIIIYLRLMSSLKDEIIDEKMRKKHILENMIYMCELNKKNILITKYIFDINNEYKLNLYEGDSLKLDYEKTFNVKEFDIIVGNPPYNEELTKTGAKPLYNKFIEYNLDKCKMLLFIIPSRWFSGGKGLDNFREMMLNRTDIVLINHFDDASKIFGNLVDIEGGINYFLINKTYKGLCDYNGTKLKLNNYDILVESKYYNIINKLLIYDNINKIYQGRYYGIESNDKKLVDNLNNDNLIKCYVSQQKGFIKYIDKKYIKKDYNNFKIITARANGKNKCFGNIFIGYPNEVHTGSYISFKVNNEIESKSLLSYLKCKLPNFMLSLRKISQDISESTCKWIPLVPLNKEWDDKDIYKYFKLSEDEIKLITNTKIIGYKI